jgi:hypothetical protein
MLKLKVIAYHLPPRIASGLRCPCQAREFLRQERLLCLTLRQNVIAGTKPNGTRGGGSANIASDDNETN